MKKKVLFVSHDASRTGAPIVLLHFLHWLKENGTIDFTILLLNEGELRKEYEKVSKTYIWNGTKKRKLLERIIDKIIKKLLLVNVFSKLPRQLKNERFDLVYLNTVASHYSLSTLKKTFKCPCVSHIHENEFTIKNFYPDSLSVEIRTQIDHFIAVSQSTYDNLLVNFNVNKKKISLCYEGIPLKKRSKETEPEGWGDDPEFKNNFIVGASGLTSWRKGVDWFIQIAFLFYKKYGCIPVKFIWVGAINKEFRNQFEYEAKRYKIEDKIIFTGSKSNPHKYFKLFDTFLLTSREDPCPLVVLENAALGNPVFCFEDSGGAVEIIKDGGGIIVPYGDLNLMAEKIFEAYQSTEMLELHGKQILRNIKQYDIELVGPKLLSIINRFSKK